MTRMSRPSRRPMARSKKAIARQLIVEAALFLAIIFLIVIALPIYFGADPVVVR